MYVTSLNYFVQVDIVSELTLTYFILFYFLKLGKGEICLLIKVSLSYFMVLSVTYIIFSQWTLFGIDTLHKQYIMVIYITGL
jgi:hypothetical protein